MKVETLSHYVQVGTLITPTWKYWFFTLRKGMWNLWKR